MIFSAILDEVMLLAGLDTESVYVANTSDSVKRLVSIANQSAVFLAKKPWQALRTRTSFTMSSATDYALPDDYSAIIPNSMYADGHVWSMDFPTTNEDWSYLKSSSSGTDYRYKARILGDRLHIYQPTSGQDVSYEYISIHPVLDTDGSTTKARFAADSDTFRLDDDLLIKDTLWRYKKLLSLDWEADAVEAKAYLNQLLGQDKSAQTLRPTDGDLYRGDPYINLWIAT